MLDTRFKKIALCTIVTALCGAAQVASAHTGIRDSGFIEGQGNTGVSVNVATGVVAPSSAAYNAFTITHGCATNLTPEAGTTAMRKNVIAMAALFPNSPNAADVKIYRYKTGTIAAGVKGVDGTVLTGAASALPVTSANDLTDDINGAVAGAGLTGLNLGVVSSNLFGNSVQPKLNATGALRGYSVYNTAKTQALTEDLISTTGLSPFKMAVPTFKTTSCAANLIVRVAVTNWCMKGLLSKNSTSRSDVWIGTDTGSVKYSMMGPNHEIMPNSRTTMGMTDATLSEQGNGTSFWPKITVHRDLVKNPLPASCNGESYDVVVQPSGADIDANLTIPGFF